MKKKNARIYTRDSQLKLSNIKLNKYKDKKLMWKFQYCFKKLVEIAFYFKILPFVKKEFL